MAWGAPRGRCSRMALLQMLRCPGPEGGAPSPLRAPAPASLVAASSGRPGPGPSVPKLHPWWLEGPAPAPTWPPWSLLAVALCLPPELLPPPEGCPSTAGGSPPRPLSEQPVKGEEEKFSLPFKQQLGRGLHRADSLLSSPDQDPPGRPSSLSPGSCPETPPPTFPPRPAP